MTLALDRRRLLQAAAGAAVAWQLAPWADRLAFATGGRGATPLGTTSDAETTTLEAFADTLIPGQKRYDGDRAIAGAAPGPGAVQAGALDLLTFPAAAIGPLLPAYAAGLNAAAADHAASRRLVLDPSLPPFVALSFRDRTAVALQLLDPSRPDYLVWYALAGIVFLAYHTAGHLHTADAVRHGHPGLRALGFPEPDPDGFWRFPQSSYRRRLAPEHPHTHRSGSPA